MSRNFQQYPNPAQEPRLRVEPDYFAELTAAAYHAGKRLLPEHQEQFEECLRRFMVAREESLAGGGVGATSPGPPVKRGRLGDEASDTRVSNTEERQVTNPARQHLFEQALKAIRDGIDEAIDDIAGGERHADADLGARPDSRAPRASLRPTETARQQDLSATEES